MSHPPTKQDNDTAPRHFQFLRNPRCGSCGACGMMRAVRDVARDFRGQTVTIAAVEDWHCPTCGEVEFASKAAAKCFFAKAQSAYPALQNPEPILQVDQPT